MTNRNLVLHVTLGAARLSIPLSPLSDCRDLPAMQPDDGRCGESLAPASPVGAFFVRRTVDNACTLRDPLRWVARLSSLGTPRVGALFVSRGGAMKGA
jgi:hypothetical protein